MGMIVENSEKYFNYILGTISENLNRANNVRDFLFCHVHKRCAHSLRLYIVQFLVGLKSESPYFYISYYPN